MMHAWMKRFIVLTPLLAGGAMLQTGCVSNALRFELSNLVASQVFVATQTIFDNLIRF